MQSEHAKLPLWKEKSFDEKLEALRKLVDDLYVYTLAPVRQELLEILSDHQPFDEKESFDLVKITVVWRK